MGVPMKTHVIYGLFRDGAPRQILYVGSATLDAMPERLDQHRRGDCRTTKKMAARTGVPLSELRMRGLCLWWGDSPEHRIMRLCRTFGMARWNAPYCMSAEDNRKGGRAMQAKWTQEERRANARRASLAAHASLTSEQKRANGRKGGRLGGLISQSRLTPAQRDARLRQARASITPEQWHTNARKAALALSARQTPEQKRARGLAANASLTPGQKATRGRRANHMRWHEKNGRAEAFCEFCPKAWG